MPIVFSEALALNIKALSCLLISLTLLHFSTYFFLLAIDHSILFFFNVGIDFFYYNLAPVDVNIVQSLGSADFF